MTGSYQHVSQCCGLPVVVGDVEVAGGYLISQGIVRQVEDVWEYTGGPA